ncbi:MAG: hypothetical protein LZ173_09650 [Thaumarchaeota archaeon]|jgi:chromosome segregation ATPase|nr:hypothetical protein [Candidatus Geocrenenecus arthurdayi]
MKIPSYALYPLILIVAVGLFLSGYYVGQYQLEKQLSINKAQLEEEKSRCMLLSSKIESLENRVLELESIRSNLTIEAEKLNQELSNLIVQLENKDKEIVKINSTCKECRDKLAKMEDNLRKLKVVIDKLRQDRELLLLLKTTPPLNRSEAKIYWNDVRSGLYKINPNLIPTVDTIIYYLDYYFDWYESLPKNATQEQVCKWLFSYTVEASEYESAISKLRDEIYLIVITDLGEALRVMVEVS